MTRPPVTTTKTCWMLRIMKSGKWKCDLGEYFDRDDVLEAISRKVPRKGEEFIPVKITTVETVEFHPLNAELSGGDRERKSQL